MADDLVFHQKLLKAVVCRPSLDSDFSRARGIVICGGGMKYFPSVWVCIRMLRLLGSELPIQVWHLGPEEISAEMSGLLAPYNVETVDAIEFRRKFQTRVLNGWELKPFSIIHSPFREVILLDADNVCIADPEYLFNSPEFLEHGAIFWPDFGRLGPDREIWRICDVPYRDEPEFESGQIVIDKVKCAKALEITMHLNEYSDFYYRHIHGDKDTFHFGFHLARKTYAMPPYPIHALHSTMCQHDFFGRRIFQHRNFAKWKLGNYNQRIHGFKFENECLKFLEELSLSWVVNLKGFRIFNLSSATQREISCAKDLTNGRWRYERVGYDWRTIGFNIDGSIGHGAEEMEQFWCVEERGTELELTIYSDAKPTCILIFNERSWEGRWLEHERMAVLITPSLEFQVDPI